MKPEPSRWRLKPWHRSASSLAQGESFGVESFGDESPPGEKRSESGILNERDLLGAYTDLVNRSGLHSEVVLRFLEDIPMTPELQASISTVNAFCQRVDQLSTFNVGRRRRST